MNDCNYVINCSNLVLTVIGLLFSGGVLSPDACDFSLDEGCDSEDDSEQDYDFSSDAGMYKILRHRFCHQLTSHVI